MVGRRLPPSRLVVPMLDDLPRRHPGQASNVIGFPRETVLWIARFEAARREPSPYQMPGPHRLLGITPTPPAR